jgi:RNA polymerase sigma factor (TIGR02999 family)
VSAVSESESSKISYELVYRELRRRAQYFLSAERPNHTLRPTEIVHEVWLRLKSADLGAIRSRDEFLALAGRVMRNLLVDYARGKKALRRGGDFLRVQLPSEILSSEDNMQLILEVDDLLEQLATIDARAATVVEMRFFGGLTKEEISEALSVSVRTVKRDWGFAKIWIRASLEERSRRRGGTLAHDCQQEG